MADGEGYTFGAAGGIGGSEPVAPEPDSASAADASPSFLGGSGSGDGGGEQFDPAIHVGPDKRNADGRFTRKRGRRANNSANSGNKKAQVSSSIDALTRALLIVHLGIASATKTPEMALDEEEGKLLAEATANVLAEFDIRPDPKLQAVIGLITAAGVVYGPRVVMIRARWKEEALAKNNDETA